MFVELLDVFGDDNMVCNAARVSYGKESNKYTEDQNAKLIKYLAEHSHWSPFAHPQLQFRIECPIYVERQIFKTQSGTIINSRSGRYIDFSDSYTEITQWRKQSKSSKQGSEGLIDDQETASLIEDSVIAHCADAYRRLIDLGVCKEQARSILPLCLNTTFIWTGSLYAFIRMCHLRLKPDAQAETRMVVNEMLQQVYKTNKFELSLNAYNLGEYEGSLP